MFNKKVQILSCLSILFPSLSHSLSLSLQSVKASRQGDSMIISSNSDFEITQSHLDSLNIEQARAANKENLDGLGGIDLLLKKLGVNLLHGRSHSELESLRTKFGSNQFPESPMSSFLELFFESFQDAILIILMCASAVSLGIGLWEDPRTGWIEGSLSPPPLLQSISLSVATLPTSLSLLCLSLSRLPLSFSIPLWTLIRT
jgi:magnesium-transporting ATPase (P-type)